MMLTRNPPYPKLVKLTLHYGMIFMTFIIENNNSEIHCYSYHKQLIIIRITKHKGIKGKCAEIHTELRHICVCITLNVYIRKDSRWQGECSVRP
jgi:hypothetical protein